MVNDSTARSLKVDPAARLRAGAERGDIAAISVQLLAAPGDVDVGGRKTGQTALHRACDRGHVDAVRLLLQHGASPDTLSTAGQTSLHLAAAKGHLAIVRMLLEAGGVRRVLSTLPFATLSLVGTFLVVLAECYSTEPKVHVTGYACC